MLSFNSAMLVKVWGVLLGTGQILYLLDEALGVNLS